MKLGSELSMLLVYTYIEKVMKLCKEEEIKQECVGVQAVTISRLANGRYTYVG